MFPVGFVYYTNRPEFIEAAQQKVHYKIRIV